MAEESQDGQEKTEEATDERREKFRDRGEIAHSREITSVFVLIGALLFLSKASFEGTKVMLRFLQVSFQAIAEFRVKQINILSYFEVVWTKMVLLVLPVAAVSASVAMVVTFAQTRMNISWKRLSPQWQRISPLSGIKRMFSSQTVTELLKGLGKMLSVTVILLLILYSEWDKVPALLNLGISHSWAFWGRISRLLFASVAALLLLIALGDYLYNYLVLEKKMKMTRQEVKEEFKQREIDPLIKNRLRKLQRDLSQRRSVEATKKATVVITNPTHYAVALKYEPGMPAPVLVAKGTDFLAMRMREAAAETGIPVVENKAVARALYKTTEVDDEIPQSLYRAVSEVIRYVFKMKGIPLGSEKKENSSVL